jgi:hypothetical protein
MTEAPKGVPPITPKSKGVEQVPSGSRAQTVGGDLYDRHRQQYGKNPPQKDSLFEDY